MPAKEFLQVNMYKKLILEYATLEFYPNVVINTIHEGVDLTEDQVSSMLNICLDHYQDRPFGYISNRTNSYSFNPMVHKNTTTPVNSMVAFAVVADNPAQKLCFTIEKIFLNKPCSYFTNIKDATYWIQKQLSLTTTSPLESQRSA